MVAFGCCALIKQLQVAGLSLTITEQDTRNLLGFTSQKVTALFCSCGLGV